MNNVVLIGNLTKDPEIRYSQTGTAVARFSIAINRGKDSNGNDLGVDFPKIVVFGKQAENCERFLQKGLKVAVQGRIQTGSYERNGQKIYTADVVASRVEFIQFRETNNNSDTESPFDGFVNVPDDLEELPF